MKIPAHSTTITLTLALAACGADDGGASASAPEATLAETSAAEPGSLEAEPARNTVAPAALRSDALPLGAPGPEYTTAGELTRRDDWASWVFLGAALNLTYGADTLPADVFSNVYMEPTAFAHFEDTGEFREGTLTAAVVYLAGTDAPPRAGGLYPTALVAFEMSVKDSTRDPEAPWQYYSFAAGATSAPANPREACFDCHTEHADTDHVFTQFYPVLQAVIARP